MGATDGDAAMTIRAEQPGDEDAVRRVNLDAFGGGPEAALVDRLRDGVERYRAFVAIDGGAVVGHILFTPVRIDGNELVGMGLAPMAVAASHQRKGIGSQLVQHGLEQLRGAGCPFVVVLGHPDYYPRFGFERASRHGLKCQWPGVPDEAFMVSVLGAEALPEGGGTVRYCREFDEVV